MKSILEFNHNYFPQNSKDFLFCYLFTSSGNSLIVHDFYSMQNSEISQCMDPYLKSEISYNSFMRFSYINITTIQTYSSVQFTTFCFQNELISVGICKTTSICDDFENYRTDIYTLKSSMHFCKPYFL